MDSLPLSIQAKLLRFLESGECLAVGEIKPYHVNVRVIAATNSDLDQRIADRKFRQDLYFRLNVVPLELPSLKQRSNDIESLIDHFVAQFAQDHNVAALKFSKLAIKKLRAYSWPGNIRELRNICERLSILLPGKVIEPENLPMEITTGPKSHNTNIGTLPELGINLDKLEADLINQALNRTNGNRSKSARLLGLSRDKLLYRIQKHGLGSH